jgi:MtfA peptidase
MKIQPPVKSFPQSWLTILRNNVFLYRTLSDSEQEKLQSLVCIFVPLKFWEGCQGLQITEEIQVTIAGQACLLLLGFDDYCFEELKTILVYPGGFLYVSPADQDDRFRYHLGEAHFKGPVILSWWDVLWCGRRRGRRNLVLHEFAHKLAELGDPKMGMPPMVDPAMEDQWEEIMAAEFERLREHAQYDRPTLLDPYGASNRAEFFAVATECFFLEPVPLRHRHPRLYDLLAQFFRQNPADRQSLGIEDFAQAAEAEHDYYQHAIAECSSAIRLRPQEKEAYELRANHYCELGEYDHAIADYDQVIRLEANDPQAYCDRGNAYLAKGCADQALMDFNKAIQLSSDFARAYCERGLAQVALGHQEEALVDLTRAIQIDPKDDTARLERGRFHFDRGEYAKAIRDFSKAIRLYPHSAVAFCDRARAYLETEEFDNVISDCDLAIEFDQNLPESYFYRGLSFHRKGESGKAMVDFTAAIRLDPEYIDAYKARAETYAALGEGEKAKHDEESVAKLEKESATND